MVIGQRAPAAPDIEIQTVGMANDGLDEIAQTRVGRFRLVLVEPMCFAAIGYREAIWSSSVLTSSVPFLNL